jgi:hypothetical protein
LRVPNSLDDVSMVSEPAGGAAVQTGNLIGRGSAKLEPKEVR